MDRAFQKIKHDIFVFYLHRLCSLIHVYMCACVLACTCAPTHKHPHIFINKYMLCQLTLNGFYYCLSKILKVMSESKISQVILFLSNFYANLILPYQQVRKKIVFQSIYETVSDEIMLLKSGKLDKQLTERNIKGQMSPVGE